MIIDASVAIKWVLPEPLSEKADDLLRRPDLLAPDFLDYETARVLSRRVRQRIVTPKDAVILRARLAETPVARVDWRGGLNAAYDLSVELRTDLGDCIFLELAIRLGDVVVTADTRFLNGVTSRRELTPYVVALGDT